MMQLPLVWSDQTIFNTKQEMASRGFFNLKSTLFIFPSRYTLLSHSQRTSACGSDGGYAHWFPIPTTPFQNLYTCSHFSPVFLLSLIIHHSFHLPNASQTALPPPHSTLLLSLPSSLSIRSKPVAASCGTSFTP